VQCEASSGIWTFVCAGLYAGGHIYVPVGGLDSVCLHAPYRIQKYSQDVDRRLMDGVHCGGNLVAAVAAMVCISVCGSSNSAIAQAMLCAAYST
jgi:NaMN:DMB phosphoribosyltransferase